MSYQLWLDLPGLERLAGLRVVVGRGPCLWQGFPGLEDLHGMWGGRVLVGRGPTGVV